MRTSVGACRSRYKVVSYKVGFLVGLNGTSPSRIIENSNRSPPSSFLVGTGDVSLTSPRALHSLMQQSSSTFKILAE